MNEETAEKQENTKTLSLISNKPGGKLHTIIMPASIFWTMILGLCVLAGIMLGVLFYESRLVMQFTQDIMSQRQEYEYLQGEYDALTIEKEELTKQVQVLSDTINKRAAEDEAAEIAADSAKVPTGFPVTGSVAEGEAPEEENALEMAVYYEASESAVVVATADGVVRSVRENVYNNYQIQIDHENGYVTVYTNAGHPLLEEGVKVYKGTPLFYVGTENTLVKYQVSLNGALINAYDVMQIDG